MLAGRQPGKGVAGDQPEGSEGRARGVDMSVLQEKRQGLWRWSWAGGRPCCLCLSIPTSRPLCLSGVCDSFEDLGSDGYWDQVTRTRTLNAGRAGAPGQLRTAGGRDTREALTPAPVSRLHPPPLELRREAEVGDPR